MPSGNEGLQAEHPCASTCIMMCMFNHHVNSCVHGITRAYISLVRISFFRYKPAAFAVVAITTIGSNRVPIW